MATEYRIDVVNKYAAFQFDDDNGDDDPVETILKLSNQQTVTKKAGPKETGPNAKKTQNAAASAKNEKNAKSSVPAAQSKQGKALTTNQDQRSRPAGNQGQTSSHQPKDNVTNRPPRFANRDAENRERKVDGGDSSWTTELRERPERGDDSRGQGGFRRGGRGQGRGNAEGFDRFGKREFERHSGSDKSGFKPTEKREGGGAHNWGTVKDDIDEQMQGNAPTAQELLESPEGPAANGDDSGVEPKLDDSPVENAVEDQVFTLDEWREKEEQKRVKASFNIRKPGEGCKDDPKWKKMYVLKKKEEDEENEEEEDEESDEHRLKQKNVVPIRITFNDNQRRGGRGGDRGGRGAGRGRGQRDGDDKPKSTPKEAPAPNVADESDFPSLS